MNISFELGDKFSIDNVIIKRKLKSSKYESTISTWQLLKKTDFFLIYQWLEKLYHITSLA